MEDFEPIGLEYLTAQITLELGEVDYVVPGAEAGSGLGAGHHFWRLPEQERSNLDVALEVDLETINSGRYSYRNLTGMVTQVGETFVGSLDVYRGGLTVVNSVSSFFGSGWGLSGLQQIVENADGSLLLIDGDGSESIFEAPINGGTTYQSPDGDFSTLERLADNTFQITTKSQTVHRFNENNQLISIVDRK